MTRLLVAEQKFGMQSISQVKRKGTRKHWRYTRPMELRTSGLEQVRDCHPSLFRRIDTHVQAWNRDISCLISSQKSLFLPRSSRRSAGRSTRPHETARLSTFLAMSRPSVCQLWPMKQIQLTINNFDFHEIYSTFVQLWWCFHKDVSGLARFQDRDRVLRRGFVASDIRQNGITVGNRSIKRARI